MTLRHLKIFVAVCETGTITGAGEKLFIAQPSISLAISELESHYGVKLFDRMSRRLYLTEVGKQFLQYATHIVSLFDEMEKGIKDWDSVGTLRIGTSITIGNHLMPTYVKQLKATYPELTVDVIIDNSKNIESYLLDNRIDIGIIEGMPQHDFLQKEAFKDDELCFICATEHPFANRDDVSLSELNHTEFLMRELGSAGREILDGIIETHNLTIQNRWQSISTQALINGVSENMGLSLLPSLLLQEPLQQQRIASFKVKELTLKRQFYLVYHKNKFLTQSAKTLIEICKQDYTTV